MAPVPTPLELVPRPLAGSVDELLEGARRRGEARTADARSNALFEQVEVDGEPCMVKYVHVDLDYLMRANGDVGCLPRRVWEAGLMDVAPDLIDHATLGAAPWGRHGWGVALLMRDVSASLVRPGDDPLSEEEHAALVDGCAGFCARTWGWRDDIGLLPRGRRWAMFGTAAIEGEEQLGFLEPVPRIAAEGWETFARRAPADVAAAIDDLRGDVTPLSDALATTPSCFLHGDWKLGNLGLGADGRTVLLDWAYPGEGPAAHELAWHLALNRARIPAGQAKEEVAAAFRAALERHGVDTTGWWERQLGLCLLGAVVQFGWEKALGEGSEGEAELGWWTDAARTGLRYL